MLRTARRSFAVANAQTARFSPCLAPVSLQSTSRPLNRGLATSGRPPRPVLPEPKELTVGDEYNIKYIDLKPSETSSTRKPTIVFLHGAPGSYEDFKYMIPLLQDHARIIGLSLPGNGGSTVLAKDKYYDRIQAATVGRSALDALTSLCTSDEPVFVAGHSFGGHSAINVTGFNEMEGRKLNVQGLVLLSSAGLRLHRGLRKYDVQPVWRMLSSSLPFVESAGKWVSRFLYTQMWRFPKSGSTEHYVAGIVRCATTDFAVINGHVNSVTAIPSFMAWARDDPLIEEEIFLEVGAMCHPGPRFAFERGGHNIQKTKAAFLADALVQWTQDVLNEGMSKHTRDVVVHP
ncbi:hypothetical protein Poli38472_014113 [Pythium oligandrum]|uniref:AB hydrolase-1 domain-containing protein n=1 Tax=Pythium oligandrum TaxID=41045 RepID=A0A8K1CNB6_PYTOL|nr:hypothetical protein Poli38472_014113 [Pythium oligandrum]|eukprot:TMW66801.1 hypothetical protein Poli38472_014113 [Pythium oligandrum]